MATGRTILLRSSWQTVNIGDVAHTPGVLHLLEKHLPQSPVILWPSNLGRCVEGMLRKRFPKLRIVKDSGDWDGKNPQPGDPTLAEAIGEAALFLHGSGPSLVGQGAIERWRKETDKPYGAYGITLGSAASSPDLAPNFPPALLDALNGMAFLFTRETTSLSQAQRAGAKPAQIGFVPDGTFAVDVRDDAAAKRLMERAGLEENKFLCAVPRLRITPYWDIHPERPYPAEERAMKTAINEKTGEPDQAKLREAVTLWVRQTGLKVLVCPEMTYEVEVGQKLVYDRLPDDVKPKVFALDRFWPLDEAASVYARSRAVVSLECHSPLIANAVGKPGLYVRQPTDTWKGQMYPDVGLGDWKFDIETTTGAQIGERLLFIHAQYDEALRKAKAASARAANLYTQTMQTVKDTLNKA